MFPQPLQSETLWFWESAGWWTQTQPSGAASHKTHSDPCWLVAGYQSCSCSFRQSPWILGTLSISAACCDTRKLEVAAAPSPGKAFFRLCPRCLIHLCNKCSLLPPLSQGHVRGLGAHFSPLNAQSRKSGMGLLSLPYRAGREVQRKSFRCLRIWLRRGSQAAAIHLLA